MKSEDNFNFRASAFRGMGLCVLGVELRVQQVQLWHLLFLNSLQLSFSSLHLNWDLEIGQLRPSIFILQIPNWFWCTRDTVVKKPDKSWSFMLIFFFVGFKIQMKTKMSICCWVRYFLCSSGCLEVTEVTYLCFLSVSIEAICQHTCLRRCV